MGSVANAGGPGQSTEEVKLEDILEGGKGVIQVNT